MKSAYEIMKFVVKCLENPNLESLNMSLNDVHSDDIFSLVVHGVEGGCLTRIFIADKGVRPFKVQLHTHRYPINLVSIKGSIVHHIATEVLDGPIKLSKYKYRSFLNGGKGLEYVCDTNILLQSYSLPPASLVQLKESDFHTMSVSKGSMWIVEELGFKSDDSLVLGIPFTVDGLYNKPEQFQINDKCQMVLKELNKIIMGYNLVGFK